MNPELIMEYQRWANRGYTDRLMCIKHDLDLFPAQTVDGLILYCPICEYRMQMGAGFYKRLERKISMAKHRLEMDSYE